MIQIVPICTHNRNNCETSHLHSSAVQVFALLGPLSMEPTDCSKVW